MSWGRREKVTSSIVKRTRLTVRAGCLFWVTWSVTMQLPTCTVTVGYIRVLLPIPNICTATQGAGAPITASPRTCHYRFKPPPRRSRTNLAIQRPPPQGPVANQPHTVTIASSSGKKVGSSLPVRVSVIHSCSNFITTGEQGNVLQNLWASTILKLWYFSLPSSA
jgi:hypothetical protein